MLDYMASTLESPIEVALFWALLARAEHASAAWHMRTLDALTPSLHAVATRRSAAEQRGEPPPVDARPLYDGPPRSMPTVAIISGMGFLIELVPQLEVNLSDGQQHRADLAIRVKEHLLDAFTLPLQVDVECDGHDFGLWSAGSRRRKRNANGIVAPGKRTAERTAEP